MQSGQYRRPDQDGQGHEQQQRDEESGRALVNRGRQVVLMRHGLDNTEETLSERIARHEELERVVPDEMRAKIAESLSRGRHAQARAYAKVLKAALAQRGEIVTVDELLAEIGRPGAADAEPEAIPRASPQERRESLSGPHWWKDPKWIIATLIGVASLIVGLLAL